MKALVEALRAQGGILAESVHADGNGHARRGDLAQRAARGPRATGHEADYELLLELIIEGSRLHYGVPQFVRTDDADLALLLGDQLYALGLARLAALGDLEAVAELADVISLVAQAHAAADSDLADAIWRAGASAIGWGASEAYSTAKAGARAQRAGTHEALVAVTVPALRDARPA
ncbi:MAG TPA: hypothetical protein VGF70_11765 [Solirubrobacteraceae bacterium]|jgi:hypothetical protein